MVMSKTQRKQLHIRSDVVDKQRETIVTADSYCLPYTMGNISEEVRKVQDDCFTPVRTMLEHTLQSMGTRRYSGFCWLWCIDWFSPKWVDKSWR